MNNLQQYDDLAHLWWADSGPFSALRELCSPRLEFARRFVPSWEGLAVCDVGCGGGFASEALARAGARVTGIDIAEGALAAARAHAAAAGLSITYLKGDARRLPFASASFDAVTCFDVLEHVSDVDAVLAELRRILRPGGILLFDTLNRNVLSRFVLITLLENLTGAVPRGTHDARMFIRPGEMRQALNRVGFEAPVLSGLLPVGVSLRRKAILLKPGGPLWVLYVGACRRPPETVNPPTP